MFDIETIKTAVQNSWDEYRRCIEKTNSSTVYNDKNLFRFYSDRAKKFKYRVQGMEDILYEMGYLVIHCADGKSVDVLERIDMGIE